MSEKRRDSKGRVLRNNKCMSYVDYTENQRSDGKYMFRYTDSTGERHTVYRWKLVSTDKIKTHDAKDTTVDDLFEQFMDIRKDLRESSRCCYKDIYRKHFKPILGD